MHDIASAHASDRALVFRLRERIEKTLRDRPSRYFDKKTLLWLVAEVTVGASYEINLYVVLATNPLLSREANRSHPSFDNLAYR